MFDRKKIFEYASNNKRADKKVETMSDERMEAVIRWANYVRNNPGKWKAIHTKFINAQFEKAYAFLKRLAKQKNGKEKIIKIYGIKNIKGYPKLLG